MSTVFTADENGKVTPTVEPQPRISPELAAKIAAEIADHLIEERIPARASYITDELLEDIASIIERVGNATD